MSTIKRAKCKTLPVGTVIGKRRGDTGYRIGIIMPICDADGFQLFSSNPKIGQSPVWWFDLAAVAASIDFGEEEVDVLSAAGEICQAMKVILDNQ